ncbi:hypothetical protein [Chachezhania sediminis]|uniref:hypothetical protein n=1 Tax=Chachezhania sediminis TaxID=2599291 RepID=UPI00131DBA87|nr:hypothetical protein [Chachezhania sediminis]
MTAKTRKALPQSGGSWKRDDKGKLTALVKPPRTETLAKPPAANPAPATSAAKKEG